MFNNYFLSVLVALGISTGSFAQVPNPGFEIQLSNGYPAHWGNTYLFSISIDTNNVQTFDSILIDGFFYQSSTDANSGQYALELKNGFNVTQNYTIPGAVAADEDSVYSSWGIGEVVPVLGTPNDFRFYYKFLSVNNDTAFASIYMTDSSGNYAGGADVPLFPASTYTYSFTPITIVPGSVPAVMNIQFRTAAVGGQCSYGSELLIDDVEINYTIVASGIDEKFSAEDIVCSPNPAGDIMHINTGAFQPVNLKVYDLSGKLQLQQFTEFDRLDLSTLATGTYILEINGSENSFKKVIMHF